MTEIEFLLNIVKILLPGRPAQALEFVARALSATHDPRLRLLIIPVISALKRHDVEAACKWLGPPNITKRNREILLGLTIAAEPFYEPSGPSPLGKTPGAVEPVRVAALRSRGLIAVAS